jgi:hypothetical protein
MSLPALASPSDLAAFLNLTIEDDDARAELVLRLASGLVRQAAGQTWVDGGGDLADVPEVAFAVCLQSAARAWVNPTAASQTSTGPFQSSHSSGVMLTDDEREQLAPLSGESIGGLSSITMRAGVDPSRIVYGWTGTELGEDD